MPRQFFSSHSRLLANAVVGRPADEFGASGEVEFAQDVADMILHRLLRDEQLTAGLTVGVAAGHRLRMRAIPYPRRQSIAGDDAYEPRRRYGGDESRGAAEDVDPQRLTVESDSVGVDLLLSTERPAVSRLRGRKCHDHRAHHSVPVDGTGWASVVKTAKHTVPVSKRLCHHFSPTRRRQAGRHAGAEIRVYPSKATIPDQTHLLRVGLGGGMASGALERGIPQEARSPG